MTDGLQSIIVHIQYKVTSMVGLRFPALVPENLLPCISNTPRAGKTLRTGGGLHPGLRLGTCVVGEPQKVASKRNILKPDVTWVVKDLQDLRFNVLTMSTLVDLDR